MAFLNEPVMVRGDRGTLLVRSLDRCYVRLDGTQIRAWFPENDVRPVQLVKRRG